jgi:P4 family phage/plasmid primase-like protien
MTTDVEESTAELSQAHRAELAASAISPEHVAARGYRTLYGTDDDKTLLKNLRIPRWAWRDDSAWPLLYLPMYRATGEVVSCQIKPAVPQKPGTENAKPQKYASPNGAAHLDIPPLVADGVRNVEASLWITEGIKKADAIASKGMPVVALSGVFNWRGKAGTLGDWEDVPLRGRRVVICFDADAKDNRNVHNAMKRLGQWLHSKGVTAVHYLIVPASVDGVPVKGVDDYFAAGGTMEGLRDAATREPPGDGPADAAFTDALLADTLCAEELDGQYRWAAGLGWMRWNGKVWAECTDVTVTETARQWAYDQFMRVLERQRNDPNRDQQTQIDGWRSVLGRGRLTAMVSLAKGILECSADSFDSDPDLLNCPNGIVDLRTGQLMPHDPDMLMTKIAGVDYVKDAHHPDWEMALTALPADVRDWYRIRIGQAITGHKTPDDTMVVSQGGGSNGKSTVIDALSRAFGKYHMVVADRALLGNASENHPTEMMDFRGARYAILEETPESRQLDVVRLKKLVGTSEITARKIRQDSVTFTATHSLFINTNYKPVVVETDHGTWRRLVLLRWPYTYRRSQSECRGPMDRVGDPTLRDRVSADPRVLEAALAWAVSGAVEWYQADRIMPTVPDRVYRDTQAWRMESDPILGFLTERLAFDRTRHVLTSELWEAFQQWMSAKSNAEWSQKTFVTRFEGHDACSQNGVHRRVVKAGPGLSLLNGASPTAASYRAWKGLRFLSAEEVEAVGLDDGPDADEDQAQGSDLEGYASYTSPVNHSSRREISVISRRVTGVTSCDAQPFESVSSTCQNWSADPFGGASGTPSGGRRTNGKTNTHSDEIAEFLGLAEPPQDAPSARQAFDDDVAAFLSAGLEDAEPEIEQPAAELPAQRHDDQPTTITDDDDFWEL